MWLFIFMTSMQLTWAEPTSTKDKDVIHWVVNDFPPFLQLNSEKMEVDIQKARGPLAEMYQDLAQYLPQYQHHFLRIPFARAEKIFTEKKQYCTLLLQETKERAQHLIFGEEVARTLPAGLVVLETSSLRLKNFMNAEEEVDLAKALSAGFRVGFVQGRAYSPQTDELIVSTPSSFKLVTDRAAGSLFVMLNAGRLDGVLAYSPEKNAFENDHPDAHKTVFYKLKQAPELISLKASCEKSPWGEATLKNIAKIVKERRFKKRAHQYLVSILPAQQRKLYLRMSAREP